jgi:hypothetical protein
VAKNYFHRDFLEAKKLFPTLEYEILSEGRFKYKVTGDFPIIDSDGIIWEVFSASLYFKSNYPYGFVVLQETSQKIPRHLDRHMNENGECCVCSILDSLEMARNSIRVLNFIESYLIPFFANQVHYEKFGNYVNGEYSHLEEGIWETLEEEFKTKNRDKIKGILKYIRLNPGPNKLCYCRSGKINKKCHPRTYARVRELIKIFN